MTSAPPTLRGPSGAAPPPPAWLATARLPIDTISTAQVLHRVHRTRLGPIFFGPGKGQPASYRFDSAGGRFGVLYIGLSRSAALAETLLRNPQRRMVAMADIEDRAVSELRSKRSLRIVRLHGDGLQQVGTDNAISTGPYGPCGLWADALWDHPDGPDGIAYQSRHDSGEICIALFERPDIRLEIIATRPLAAILKEVGTLLDRYGKSIALPP